MTQCVPSRIDSGQTEVFRELLARKPAAMTELASLGGRRLLRHLPLARAGVVPVEIYYRCLGAFVLKGQKTESVAIYCGPGWHYPDYTIRLATGEPIGLGFFFC